MWHHVGRQIRRTASYDMIIIMHPLDTIYYTHSVVDSLHDRLKMPPRSTCQPRSTGWWFL